MMMKTFIVRKRIKIVISLQNRIMTDVIIADKEEMIASQYVLAHGQLIWQLSRTQNTLSTLTRNGNPRTLR